MLTTPAAEFAECAELRGVTIGLEEEIFITEPTRPSLGALYVMARLLWSNPRYYYTYSATNFARGKEIRECLMSSVEIATRPHATVDALLADLQARRADLARAARDAYLVPVGHLFDLESPTNTGGLHVHIGVAPERRLVVYNNLAYFLPVLLRLSASSPFAGGRYFGPSYRIARSYAIGTLRPDPFYRFQDIILSRRLGTIEIRAFDPVWDLERLRWLLQAVRAIASLPEPRPLDLERYTQLRQQAAQVGYTPDLKRLYVELRAVIELPEELLEYTIADALAVHMRQYGLQHTYAALDHAYRVGQWSIVAPRPVKPSLARAVLGIMGYYLPKLPYIAYKAWREWH
ncbi:MAG: glutamate-cysteine ligase family protein [Fimbriimonadales bacterium]|nr:glutamate-cysteine ligase family protein [Fimbriimonadales bacterium]MDW8051824.1 glutamate-cysteine ligase family protein [Armatimonadota bacterium]